jgi:hypothetical protein
MDASPYQGPAQANQGRRVQEPLILGAVPTDWEVEMKRVLTVLKFAVAVICVFAVVSIVVFGQGDDEKTWDDVVWLYDQAAAAHNQARFQDAIYLFKEALGIVRALDERYAAATIPYPTTSDRSTTTSSHW